MKTIIPTFIILGLIVAAFLGGLFYHRVSPTATPQQLTLEQILSIRELHLVKHRYNDMFPLHRKNDSTKPIRAIVQVPVTVTAFLNLKEVTLEYKNDSLTKVILPHAILNEPVCEINHMIIRETRAFQLHAGKDLYPEVGSYLGAAIEARMDSTRHLAITHQILIQAEAEGKEYIESILQALGYNQVLVTFNDASTDKAVMDYIQARHKHDWLPSSRPTITARLFPFPWGLLPKGKL
jgi:hypothetical protein